MCFTIKLPLFIHALVSRLILKYEEMQTDIHYSVSHGFVSETMGPMKDFTLWGVKWKLAEAKTRGLKRS